MDDPDPPVSSVAPATSWSLILAAQAPAADRHSALDRLCRLYWGPLYVFARRQGLAPADAEDATQDFFARILADDWLAQADRSKGRFRGFLYQSMTHHLADARRRSTARKRGGGARHESLDQQMAWEQQEKLATPGLDPAQAFDQAWAGTVLELAMNRLAREEEAAGRAERFAALRPFVTQPPTAGDYDRLATRLQLARPTVAVTVHRLGRRYRELIRAAVAETVANPADVEPELRHLLQAVTAVGGNG